MQTPAELQGERARSRKTAEAEQLEAKWCLSSRSVWFKTSLGAGLRVMVALQNQGFNKQIPCLKHSWRNMQKIAAFHLKQCLFLLSLQALQTGVRPALSEWLSCWAAVTLSLVGISLYRWYGAHEMLYELAAMAGGLHKGTVWQQGCSMSSNPWERTQN